MDDKISKNTRKKPSRLHKLGKETHKNTTTTFKFQFALGNYNSQNLRQKVTVKVKIAAIKGQELFSGISFLKGGS